MKKRFLAVLITMAMVLTLVSTLAACKQKPFKFDVSFVENLKTDDLKNASGLGVGKATSANSGAQASLGGSIFASVAVQPVYADSTNESKNYLWFEPHVGAALQKVSFTVTTGASVELGKKTIGQGDEITQDELPAEINRAMSSRGFTFVQFVPIIPSGREYDYLRGTYPYLKGMVNLRNSEYNRQYLKAENDLPCEFDRGPYKTDEYHASFIIENESGNIYPIPKNYQITDANGGMIYASANLGEGKNGPFNWFINDDDELVLEPLFVNPMIVVYAAFKDAFGSIFVDASLTDDRYFNFDLGISYLLSDQGVVIGVRHDFFSDTPLANAVWKMGAGGEQEQILETDVFTFKKTIYQSYTYLYAIEGGKVYIEKYYGGFSRVDITTLLVEQSTVSTGLSLIITSGTVLMYIEGATTKISVVGLYDGSEVVLAEHAGVSIRFDNDYRGYEAWILEEQTANTTIRYKVAEADINSEIFNGVVTYDLGNGKAIGVVEESKIVYEQQTIIIQPLR